MSSLKIKTNKRVCFWGAPASTVADADLNVRLQHTGFNTRNMLIGAGLFNATEASHKSYHPGFDKLPPEAFDEHFDIVFIPASNFVRNGENLELPYQYFSKTNTQFFVFGLGSQASGNELIELQPGTDRFLRLVAERSGSLGVRGARTAELLLSLGIRNVDIVGCPSILDFPDSLSNRRIGPITPESRIATNYSNNVREYAFSPSRFAEIESLIFYELLRQNTYYILQNEEWELEILKVQNVRRMPEKINSALLEVGRLFGTDGASPEVRQFLFSNVRMFFDVAEWIARLKTMDFSIGSRFHGNVAALLAGIPALFIAHDNRTLELCEFYSFPHVRVDNDYVPLRLEEMLEKVDYNPFFARLPLLIAQWKSFIARNGLEFR